MKRFNHIALILPIALLVLLPSMRAFVPWMAYFTNQNYYSEVCENKARPEMHCNGACQVRKNMALEEGQEAQSTLPRIPLVEVEEVNFLVVKAISITDMLQALDRPTFKEATWVLSEPFFEIPVPPPWRA